MVNILVDRYKFRVNKYFGIEEIWDDTIILFKNKEIQKIEII